MKRIINVGLMLLTVFILASCGKTKQNEKSEEKQITKINVMSFNLRYDNSGDGENNWQFRKDTAAKIIKEKHIDIIGTQEALANMMEDLKERLPEYNAIGVGREDGINQGEYSSIFYKKDRFEEIKSGNFWLSETPNTPGSLGWDAACTRIATWAVLKDLQTELTFFFVNTHLDHVGVEARKNGVELMIQKAMKEANGLPFIITGDFNAEPNSDVIGFVKNYQNPKIVWAREIAKNKSDKTGTFHDFGKIAENERSYIDYIFVSENATVPYYEVVDEKLNEIYISDHNPIWATIELSE